MLTREALLHARLAHVLAAAQRASAHDGCSSSSASGLGCTARRRHAAPDQGQGQVHGRTRVGGRVIAAAADVCCSGPAHPRNGASAKRPTSTGAQQMRAVWASVVELGAALSRCRQPRSARKRPRTRSSCGHTDGDTRPTSRARRAPREASDGASFIDSTARVRAARRRDSHNAASDGAAATADERICGCDGTGLAIRLLHACIACAASRSIVPRLRGAWLDRSDGCDTTPDTAPAAACAPGVRALPRDHAGSGQDRADWLRLGATVPTVVASVGDSISVGSGGGGGVAPLSPATVSASAGECARPVAGRASTPTAAALHWCEHLTPWLDEVYLGATVAVAAARKTCRTAAGGTAKSGVGDGRVANQLPAWACVSSQPADNGATTPSTPIPPRQRVFCLAAQAAAEDAMLTANFRQGTPAAAALSRCLVLVAEAAAAGAGGARAPERLLRAARHTLLSGARGALQAYLVHGSIAAGGAINACTPCH